MPRLGKTRGAWWWCEPLATGYTRELACFSSIALSGTGGAGSGALSFPSFDRSLLDFVSSTAVAQANRRCSWLVAGFFGKGLT